MKAARRVDDILGKLPENLEWTGEFGPELVLFLPFCTWLDRAGLLDGRTITTYRGMSCFYDHFSNVRIVEKNEPRIYVKHTHRPKWLPHANEHTLGANGRSPYLYFPDLRKKFQKLDVPRAITDSALPILIVHNKFNYEWNTGPINFFDEEALSHIFTALSKFFLIVYIRHGMDSLPTDFSGDHNIPQNLDDRGIISEHPQVLCFDDLYKDHLASGGEVGINLFKNSLYSRCRHFITTQGGGAHHIAFFSGSIMSILHIQGRENRLAYSDGYYGFLADIPPIRVVCKSRREIIESLPIMEASMTIVDRVHVGHRARKLVRKFSPWRQRLATSTPDPGQSIGA